MTQSQKLLKQSSKLLKQAPDGLIAHLYEHIISNRISERLFASGYLEVLDYDIWGYTRNRTCSIDTRFRSEAARAAFIKTFAHIDEPVSVYECLRSVEECSCEYARKYEIVEDTLLKELNGLTQLPWISARQYGIDKADDITSVNRQYSAPGIKYGHCVPGSFMHVIFEYTIPRTFFAENTRLKPLGMIVIEALGMNQINLISRTHRCYDTNASWQENVQRLACSQYFLFSKSKQPILAELTDVFQGNLKLIGQRHFTEKLHILLTDLYAEGKEQYFSDVTMYNIAEVEIGAEGWKAIATKKNIELILENLSIRVTNLKESRVARGIGTLAKDAPQTQVSMP